MFSEGWMLQSNMTIFRTAGEEKIVEIVIDRHESDLRILLLRFWLGMIRYGSVSRVRVVMLQDIDDRTVAVIDEFIHLRAYRE